MSTPSSSGCDSRRSRRLCAEIAAGLSLEAACAKPDMPKVTSVRRWLLDSAHFRRQYAHAKRLQAERLIEQVVEIADETKDGAGDAETRRRRLRIDARKWAVARLCEAPFPEDDADDAPPEFIA